MLGNFQPLNLRRIFRSLSTFSPVLGDLKEGIRPVPTSLRLTTAEIDAIARNALPVAAVTRFIHDQPGTRFVISRREREVLGVIHNMPTWPTFWSTRSISHHSLPFSGRINSAPWSSSTLSRK